MPQSMGYAQSFHPDFVGYALKSQERTHLYESLGVMGDHDIEALELHSGRVFVYIASGQGWQLNRVYEKLPGKDRVVGEITALLESS